MRRAREAYIRASVYQMYGISLISLSLAVAVDIQLSEKLLFIF